MNEINLPQKLDGLVISMIVNLKQRTLTEDDLRQAMKLAYEAGEIDGSLRAAKEIVARI